MDEDDLPIIVCGTFFPAGLGEENFASLTEEQIRQYKELYDNIMVITAEKERPPQEKGACSHSPDVEWSG